MRIYKNRVEGADKNQGTVFSILISLCAAHFLNDALQMLIPAIYPLLKTNFSLSFTQIGIITLVFQMVASIFQPIVGNYTDKHPQPYSLAVGMGFTLIGLLCLAYSNSFATILISVALVGFGSSIFHPESSRMARYASGGRAGMAQSIFQVGGNTGTAIGPLLAAAIIVPFGQHYIAVFSILAFIAILILVSIGKWFRSQGALKKKSVAKDMQAIAHISKRRIKFAIATLMILIFSKFFYLAAMKNFLTFYMIKHFGVSKQASEIYLFIFLAAVAAGTLLGGSLGDKYGRKTIIWVSILGVAPFTILLPFANLFWTVVLMILIGVILASAFPAIIVYGQELMPHKLGMVSGLFYGFSFGMGAIGAAALGILSDHTSVYFMFEVASYLPLLGLFAGFLPNIDGYAKKGVSSKGAISSAS